MLFSQKKLQFDNIYVNNKCGYEFIIPFNWIGWYFTNDMNPQVVAVRFYGKSIRETFPGEYSYVLIMFFIL